MSLFNRYSKKRTLALLSDELNRDVQINVLSEVAETSKAWNHFKYSFVTHLHHGAKTAANTFEYDSHEASSQTGGKLDAMISHIQQDNIKFYALASGVDGVLIGLSTDPEAVAYLADSLNEFGHIASQEGSVFYEQCSTVIQDYGEKIGEQILPCMQDLAIGIVNFYGENPIQIPILLCASFRAVFKKNGDELLKHLHSNFPEYWETAAEAFAPVGEMAGLAISEMAAVGNDAVGGIIENSGDVVGAVGEVGFDAPWITVAIAGLREYSLVANGKKEWIAGAKDAVIDAGGVAIGAKVGAVIGIPFGPIGGILGGVGGSIIGKVIGNEIRYVDLNNAIENYALKQESAQMEIQSMIDLLAERYSTVAQDSYNEFSELSKQVIDANNFEIDEYFAALCREIDQLLEGHLASIVNFQKDYECKLNLSEKLSRSVMYHSKNRKFRDKFEEVLNQRIIRLRETRKMLYQHIHGLSTDQEKYADLHNLSLPSLLDVSALPERLEKIAKKRFMDFVTGNLTIAVVLSAKSRDTSARLVNCLQEGVGDIKERSTQIDVNLRAEAHKVDAEKAKVGLT